MKRHFCFPVLFFILGISGNLYAQFNFNVIHTSGETNHEIVFASYNSDGTYIVTAGSDSSLIVWNTDRRTIYRTLTGLNGRPNAAVFSVDNKYLLSGGKDNKVSMWDLGVIPSKIVKTFEGYSGPVKSIDVSPDGKYFASGSAGGTIKIWELRNANLVFDLKGQNRNKEINSVAFSPDGKILASGGADGIIILWNTGTGIKSVSQTGQKSGIQHLSFSPDGKLLASCGFNNDIMIWQLPGLTNPVILSGHKDWVQTFDFSPDGKSLISGGRDGYIILWDVASGKILHKSEKQQNIVLFLDFDPAGPDFISSYYQSVNLETWALSGLDESQWKKPAGIVAVNKIPDNIVPDNQEKVVREPAKDVKLPAGDLTGNNSMIELFSPLPVQGKIVHDKDNILIVGRVSDPQGINTFLINKNKVTISEGGVFQVPLSLSKGENEVDIIAINNKGIMNERKFVIDCTAENAVAAGEGIPDIDKSKYFALLIGVSEYQDDEIPDLDNPIKDAQNLYDVLTTQYNFEKENVKFLKNPTQKEIFIAFEDMGKVLSQNDNLLIFYAGHGVWDSKGKVGYWLPADASRDSKVNWFSNSNLRDFIGGMEAKHTILIADACFSGAIFKSRAVITEATPAIQKLFDLPSRKAMTSSVLQPVPDESEFIKYLIKRLSENKEYYLPSEALFSTLKTSVMNNSPNIPQYGVIQNVGDEGGDFIFKRR
jgi:WD40 repeat protein